MTLPSPDTLEREKEKLYVTDAELIRKLGVPEKLARANLAVLDREKKHGFPPKLKQWGDKALLACLCQPWATIEFRRRWRTYATAVGIPTTVRNMDSRAGAITEASDAGASIEHIRHAATHSDIGMTQRYSRNSDDKIVNVQLARLKHRNGSKNEA